MPGRIQDRVALVTGSSGGLGRSICLRLASEGAKVCCVDLYDSPRNKTNAATGKADDFNNRIKGESTSDEISRLYGEGRAIFLKADITKAEDVKTAVADCAKHFGRVSRSSYNTSPAQYHNSTEIRAVRHHQQQRRHLRGIRTRPIPRRARNERRRLGQDHGD